MKRQWKDAAFVTLFGMSLMFTGCSGGDDNDNSGSKLTGDNQFPTVHGIQVSPNAAIYVDDTVTLTPATTDPDNNELRYVWSNGGGVFNPIEAVGPTIQWTAPSQPGTYSVTVVADDANGGTSQVQVPLKVIGGDQSGTVDVVGGARQNPVGGTSDIGYIDKGDVLTLWWDNVSPITADSTRPDETKYAPDGSRLDNALLTVVSTPQYGYADGLPVRDGARYALIGRIEDGEWFALTPGADEDGNGVPDTFSMTATARGRVILSLNEQKDLLVDNTGFWRFAFEIVHY